MRGYLLDTHIWFWYLIGSKRLSGDLRDLIDQSKSKCWYSPISIWELGILAKRNRIEIKGDFRTWISEALKLFPIKEAALNKEVSILSGEIVLPHKDPADHFIAATSLVFDIGIIIHITARRNKG